MAKINLLPQLYKRTSTGAIQRWLIGVAGTNIHTEYGQVGGKTQTTSDSVKIGKNQGRKNETAPEEQAKKEALAQWTKKKKTGYVESLEDAESGKTDEVIEGGIVPMLAKVYEEHSSKINGAVAVQPKLDGGRMICMIDDTGAVSLWTRTRKRIYSMEHIAERMAFLARKLNLKNVVFDGECYADDLKHDFEKLMSAFRKDRPTPEATKLQYHIYDVVSDKGYIDRLDSLSDIMLYGGSLIRVVETVIVEGEQDIMKCYNRFVEEGYEGLMVRLLDRPYEKKRSDQLLKLKQFQDAEFEITGIEEGRGKLAGHCGNFVCRLPDAPGYEFGVKMSGETSFLKTVFENQKTYIGKMLTVQYQGLTKDGIPRFPVGLRLRGDE